MSSCGSTTTASRLWREARKYDAQPVSSCRNCLKYIQRDPPFNRPIGYAPKWYGRECCWLWWSCVRRDSLTTTEARRANTTGPRRVLLVMRTRTYRAKAFLEAAARLNIAVTVATEREQP